MLHSGRHITCLGSNLCNTSILNIRGLGHRTLNTGCNKWQNAQTDKINDDTSSAASTYEPPKPIISRTYIDDHRRDMKPVMKELFLARMDTRILSFPDVINNDAYHDIFTKCAKVKDTLEEKKGLIDSIDKNGKVSKDLLYALRSQGFYGLNVPEKDGGEGLSMTETLRMIEELSVNLSLSESIVTPLTMGYKAIQLFGTEEQKTKYLPEMISGQKIGAICISDETCGSDPCSVSKIDT